MAKAGRIFKKMYTKWRYQQRRRFKARMHRNKLQKLKEDREDSTNVEVVLEKED